MPEQGNHPDGKAMLLRVFAEMWARKKLSKMPGVNPSKAERKAFRQATKNGNKNRPTQS